jgi:hypothetical protein
MRAVLTLTGIFFVLIAGVPGHAFEINSGAEADIVSDYVWRGMVFSKGFVLEPYGYVSAYGITPAIWANVQLQDEHNTLDEIDFIVSYNRSLSDLYVEVGYVYYYLPEFKYEEPEGAENPKIGTVSPVDTSDVFIVLNYPILPPLSVYSDHYITVAGNGGAYYFDVGVGAGRALADNLALDAYFEAGFGSPKFNDFNLGREEFALNLVETGVSATYTLYNVMYVRPHLGYTALVDGDLRDAAGAGNTSFWFGGAAVGIER